MSTQMNEIPPEIHADVALLFDFNQMHHELRPCSIGIGLGSHDPNVPVHTADLYHQGMFPLIVFTGANAPTTIDRFPRGEAVHFAEVAMAHGVPTHAILLEKQARNTAENVTLTRRLLDERHIRPSTAIVVCRPYQQRRAYATFRALWPELQVLCTSRPIPLVEYVETIGDPTFVINMIVGDTQRVIEDPHSRFSEEEPAPASVLAAFERLVSAGFTSRLVKEPTGERSHRDGHSAALPRGIDRHR